ncbi:hypothetical protein DXU06_04870 [Bradyrhizobium elkanii]
MPRWFAAAIFSVFALSAFALFILAEATPPEHIGSPYGDVDAYLDILKLMRGGSGYYKAVHDTLLAHGYGTTSVFNWRTPAWLELLALFPSIAWAQALLTGVASASLFLAYRMVRESGSSLLALVALLGIVPSIALIASPRGVVLSEVVAGLLILFSIVSYGNDLWGAGLLAALAALFIRELAAPYILICFTFALYHKNWREFAGWAIGLPAYFVYFAWHWFEVMQQLGPNEISYPDGWMRFGGFGFVLQTAHFNGLLDLAPLLITAVLLPAALMGLFAWRHGLRAAITVTTYLCIFAVVGKPFNFYWGALYTPLLMLGLPWAVPATYEALVPKRPVN